MILTHYHTRLLEKHITSFDNYLLSLILCKSCQNSYQLVAGTGDTDNAAFTIVGDQLQIGVYNTQSS
ncbi:MAG: hypothetical protein GDA56_12065 [Hormoscilla sp. GM7CHS1pb]|nr:hypothetical protein [Hormoscilla sp. GM7CHS1pb]